MKPDGVDTATMEPMEALNAGPAVEVAPGGEAQDQALPATQTEGEPQQTEATNKTGKDKSGDLKAKTKAPAKTKTPTSGTKTSTTGSRPTTGQSHLINGAQKSQANGINKKTTTAGLDKKTSTTAATKKPVSSTSAPTTKTPNKVAEKKPVGTARPASAPANGVKTTGAAQPIKKAPAAPANGLKSKPKTTAPAPAPRPATASTTKTSITGSPVTKTTRSVGSAPAAPKPGTPTSASKTSTTASRPTTATPKTPATTAKPSPAKTTAPPAGRTPTPKTTTPVKKDVSKQSSAPAAKKPTSSPLTRPAPTKSTKPDTPKPASTAKAESASKKSTTSSKAADVKISKPKESKATPSKEVNASPKTTGSKPSTKTSSPKKSVGSSTPKPLKGGPKASQPADAAATEAENKDMVPAMVAATTAAAAVVSMVTSEAAPEDLAISFVPVATEEAPEDLFTQVNPAASKVKLEGSFTTPIPASSEDSKDDSKEMAKPVIAPSTMKAPEDIVAPVILPVSEGSPEDSVTHFSSEETSEDRTISAIPPTSDEVREETVSPVIPSEETPEDVTTSVVPPTSYEAREETVSPTIPYEETPEDVTTSVVPPTSYEAREETVSPTIPYKETPEDVTISVVPPTSYEAREETVSPAIPSEETPEDVTISVVPPTSYEAREETVSPAITSEETPEDVTTSVVPPTSYEAREETVSPIIPSEETPEDVTTSVIPPTSYEAREETVSPVIPSEETPEDVTTSVVPPTSYEAQEETVSPIIPSEETPEHVTTSVIPPTSYEAREETVSPVIPSASEQTPEDVTTAVIPPTSYEAREETVSPVIPSASEETPEDVTTAVTPPTSYEAREETVSPVIPSASEETPEDVTTAVIPPTSYEAREETVSPVIPSVSEETPEDVTTAVIPPTSYEAREETVSPVIPSVSEERPEDVTTAVIPPTSYETPEESISPVMPPASDKTPEDTTASVIPPNSYEAPIETTSSVIPQAFEDEPEDTFTPVISPTSDEVEHVYPQDVPQSMDTNKDDNTMSQLADAMDLVSLKESVPAVSPLGTTVLSPPSSPTGPTSVPVELPSSVPFLSTQGPSEPWAQSSSLYSSSATIENQEQDMEREHDEESEQDDEKDQDDIQMPSAAENVIEDFDLMGSTSGNHIRNAAPISPLKEREEAVEKAEEEINEDNDEEEEEEKEEEEEEEEELKEIGLKESVPQTEKEVHFKKGMADFASSDWGMMQSDHMYSSNKHDSEVTSPFNAEDSCSAKDTDDFTITEADREQPFTGPPGIQSFGSEDEEEDEEAEHLKEDMDLALEHDDEHLKQQKDLEEADEDVEMVRRGMAESGLGVRTDDGNEDEDEDEDDYRHESDLVLNSMGHTAGATSMPLTAAWSNSIPFSDSWAQPSFALSESNLSDSRVKDPDTLTKYPADLDIITTFSAEPDTPPKSPFEAFLNKSPPLIQTLKPQPDIQEERGISVSVESGILAPPTIGMSQSSTLSGTVAAHSSSETSTPEELQDYDSSSGVESRSDKQQTPVPAMHTDMEQDLGIHLERGDGEEEEAETLPVDEVLGDAATAPASVPSSPSISGDEASDTEGEMQINDPDVAVDDNATVPHNLTALEEDGEAPEQIGEEDGDTPQSANSVASYGFDCSASISNAHSVAESCGKSPGIFSLENEEQLPEEAKDPSFIKELTLPAATAYSDDLMGCPVDLLPISEPTERDAGYMLCSKTDPGAMEEMDPESPMHLSPQHGDGSDGQPPYYSAICDKTDNFLAGKPRNTIQTGEHQLSLSQQENGNSPRLTQELYDNNYLAPLPNTHRQLQQPQPRINVQHVDPPSRVPLTPMVPNVLQRRLDQHQLQLRHIWQRQEQERLQRLCLEEERQRQEQQRALERQRRELLQLQLQQQQQEHRFRRQLLQRQLEMEKQQRLKHQSQVKRQVKGQPCLQSSSYGLCTIYEAMETSEEEEGDAENGSTANQCSPNQTGHSIPTDIPLRVANGNLRRPPPQELDWNTKLDMVQQLINEAMLLAGEDGCLPLLYLPGQGGGILSPLESSMWPNIMSHFDCSTATVASVSSYSPSSQASSPQGDWTVVELDTHH